MDQDIRFQLDLSAAASNAGAAYLRVPYRCTVRDVRATIQNALASLSSISTVSIAVTNGSTSLGTVATSVASVSSAAVVAAGAIGEYTTDASSGSTVLAADSLVKFAVAKASLASAASSFLLDIELDPYARSL